MRWKYKSMSVLLTPELAENLNIHVSQITGLLQDSRYRPFLEQYQIDADQCMLWWEVSRMIEAILGQHDYEDLDLRMEQVGLEVKQILADNPRKYPYITQLLIQYNILHDNSQVGQIVWETTEDIQIIYDSLSKVLKQVFASQQQIQEMVQDHGYGEEE